MISIVIPTLNSGKYLEATLESIVSQLFQGFEVIIVDSQSEDSTLRIVKEFQDSGFRDKIHLYSMRKLGQVRAINYGMSQAKGDILTFINSDDVYEQDCFMLIDRIFGFSKVEWAYGIGKVIDEKGKPTRSLVTTFKSLWWMQNSSRVLSWFDYISQPTVFWRKELWEKVGQFNPEYPLCFDYDYWLRASKISKPVFLEHHLANWRAHSDAISVRNTNSQIDESLRINVIYAQSWWDLVIQNLVAWVEKIVYWVME
jgi:glycosyltransferase involved in cell wall biosynthesis